ncbi:nitroreductase family protein [Paenibacillus sp. IB182496]|uniref:Nitroreductase family protein n=1 Tax=Paenibacillus sabuli TaxID=2772509 RepID=A0A927GRE9_9BACL|nr:nitroreductase family protein [Paenibacillus sabuli]MBD2844890.1 nitroreductase family protein [Paenibacillus sabuli]
MESKQTDRNPAYADVVRARRSVRAYDPAFKISREELKDLLAEATLAPSSSNLQPWRFLVIDEAPLKQKLLPIAFNQQQVADASAIVAVLADLEAVRQAEAIYGRAVEAGYMTEEIKTSFVARLTAGYAADPAVYREVALVDGGLVAMQLMLSAKARGYDSVPMGGYDAAAFIQAFELPPTLVPVMLIAIGKAAAPGRPTTRLGVDEITHWNGIGGQA